jgi:hypothetical protein
LSSRSGEQRNQDEDAKPGHLLQAVARRARRWEPAAAAVSWGLFICMAIYTAMFSCPFRDTRVENMLTQLSIVFLMTKTQLTQHYI